MSLKHLNSNSIKAEAQNLGFFACGIAKAEPVDPDTAQRVTHWVQTGNYATMDYMARNTDKRLNPDLLMPGVKSIVSVALNYTPAFKPPVNQLQLSVYAYGKDYHKVVKDKLFELAALLKKNASDEDLQIRVFCDTAPVLERYWAWKAGLGWTGKNHQLIIPHAGSMFFLGELFINVELNYDEPMPSRCGTCHACIDACPTGAISEGQNEFKSENCLSYQLIENRGELSEKAANAMGEVFYGCDRCQKTCPWNRFARPSKVSELQPNPQLLNMTTADWQHLTVEEYQQLFKGSAVKRAKYSGLMRNITTAINHKNHGENN